MTSVDEVKNYIASEFPQFGVNKQHEMVRLIYEIAKRENCPFKDVLTQEKKDDRDYEKVKTFLLKRRFPLTLKLEKNPRFSMTALNVSSENERDVEQQLAILPKIFYIEEAVKNFDLTKRLKNNYPQIPQIIIKSYKDYNKLHPFNLQEYNKRTDKMFIIKENYAFLLNCPCTSGRVSCGYNILNVGSGCSFECVYCFLQSYSNSHGVTIPANIDDFFAVLDGIDVPTRIGTGQFTDSLIFDHITGYSKKLIGYFRHEPHLTLEFKTKSDNIRNIIEAEPARNIVISWSLNPQNLIDGAEYFTASLEQRLNAALACQKAGYHIGFHFDPIIFHEQWESEYKDVIDRIGDTFAPETLSLISLGCLRMMPKQKQVIENRFPDASILDGEFILGYDDKLRYPFELRADIYQKMVKWIRSRNREVTVYLCMESPDMYKRIAGDLSYRF
ncbi:MAG: hypothetical protein KAR05_10520 [Candidatus Omnitrophica bacterium]|nr:hypothetical protein [Candidatus Omnitrophota bacterium]